MKRGKSNHVLFVAICLLQFVSRYEANCQQDSLAKEKVVLMYKKWTRIVDNHVRDLQRKGVEKIIVFNNYGNFNFKSVVMWKEGDHIKGIKVCSVKSEPKNKTIKDSDINQPCFDSLFSNKCDIIWKLGQAGSQVDVSENFVGYYKKYDKGNMRQTYFRFSNFLSLGSFSCACGLSELIWH